MTTLGALVTGFLFAVANVAHCAGMCGGFALRAGAPPGRWTGFLAYGAGKALTYGLLGAVAGSLGAGVLGAGEGAQSALGFLVAAVLAAGAIVRLRGPAPGAGGGHLARFLQPLLAEAGRADSAAGRFALGALTAALPCGVAYFAALQASATGSRASAFVLMMGFAAGTMPGLGAVALVGASVRGRIPPRALRFASASVMLVLAAIAAWRAAAPLLGPEGSAPCCH
jgi:sulfite exporter TauE/SafE